MSKQLHILLVIGLLLFLSLFLPAAAFAGEGPPPDPGRIEPPPIIGVNTGGTLSEGDTGDLTPSGTLTGFGIDLPLGVGAPRYVEVAPQTNEGHSPPISSLGVPLRAQDPADVTCGAAALGMALDFAALNGEGEAPSSDALVGDLREAGLLYEGVGTGVEELAYLARERGYQGSYAFHDWTLAQLQAQLDEGRPPVVALGANGAGQPGHFVTVTGISDDGQWVQYNDPTLGAQTVSAQEFNRLWGWQGHSGMVAQSQPLPAAHDPLLPWMGLFGTLSALAVLAGQASARADLIETYRDLRRALSNPLRRGLGGRLSGGTGPRSARSPTYGSRRVRLGWRRVPRQVPVYETRKVKVGTRTVSSTVPNYAMKRVRVGWKTEEYRVRVTRYRRETYTDWVRDTYRVPVYRTRKYVRYYRRKRVKRTRWVRRGWRWTLQTTYTTKREPAYGRRRVRVGWRRKTRWKRVTKTRRVPYTTYETRTRRVPEYDLRRVRDGWKTVTYQVPKYEKRRVRVGTKTVYERVPDYRWEKVRTGWKGNPRAKSTPPPTPTPHPKPVQTPEPTGTPYPYLPPTSHPYPLNDNISTLGSAVKYVRKAKGIWNSTALAFNRLPSGHYSVSAPGKPPGSKLLFRLKQGYAGTRYNPATLAPKTAKNLLGKAASGLGLSLGISVGVNLYDYGVGKNSDKGIGSNEFYASTAVDFAQAGLTGLVAAGIVAGVIVGAGVLGVTAVATAPLWAAGLAAAVVGYGISRYVEKRVDIKKLKEDVADGFKTFPGILDGGKTIVAVAAKRAKDAIGNTIQNIASSASNAAQAVKKSVSNTVKNAKKTIGNFVGGIFGGNN